MGPCGGCGPLLPPAYTENVFAGGVGISDVGAQSRMYAEVDTDGKLAAGGVLHKVVEFSGGRGAVEGLLAVLAADGGVGVTIRSARVGPLRLARTIIRPPNDLGWQGDPSLGLVMPRAGSSLAGAIKERFKPWQGDATSSNNPMAKNLQATYDTVKAMIKDALVALQALHTLGILHGDAKTQNFVVVDDPVGVAGATLVVQAIDFGLAAPVALFRPTPKDLVGGTSTWQAGWCGGIVTPGDFFEKTTSLETVAAVLSNDADAFLVRLQEHVGRLVRNNVIDEVTKSLVVGGAGSLANLKRSTKWRKDLSSAISVSLEGMGVRDRIFNEDVSSVFTPGTAFMRSQQKAFEAELKKEKEKEAASGYKPSPAWILAGAEPGESPRPPVDEKTRWGRWQLVLSGLGNNAPWTMQRRYRERFNEKGDHVVRAILLAREYDGLAFAPDKAARVLSEEKFDGDTSLQAEARVAVEVVADVATLWLTAVVIIATKTLTAKDVSGYEFLSEERRKFVDSIVEFSITITSLFKEYKAIDGDWVRANRNMWRQPAPLAAAGLKRFADEDGGPERKRAKYKYSSSGDSLR